MFSDIFSPFQETLINMTMVNNVHTLMKCLLYKRIWQKRIKRFLRFKMSELKQQVEWLKKENSSLVDEKDIWKLKRLS